MSERENLSNQWQILHEIALMFNEGVVSDYFSRKAEVNVYGRTPHISTQGDIAFNMGLAASGLRTIAFLTENQINDSVDRIKQAVDQKIATVVVARYKNLSEILKYNTSGACVLSASTWQECADFLCIAHYISERSLIPAVVAVSETAENNAVSVNIDPQKAKLFLGNVDEWIPSPTPAQRIIFGEQRKRIPNWFDPDLPVTLGAVKNLTDSIFQSAAHHNFIENHLQEIINDAFIEFNLAFGCNHWPLKIDGAKKDTYAVISTGLDEMLIKNACEIVNSKQKYSVTKCFVNQLLPFPESELKERFTGLKGLTVLDQSLNRTFSKEVKATLYTERIPVFSALLVYSVGLKSIENALMHMINGGAPNYFLDTPVTKRKSAFPKHEVLLNTINREYPKLLDSAFTSPESAINQKLTNINVPKKIRQFKDSGPAYTKVSRFYDDVITLYNSTEMIADPFQAVSIIPSNTASLKDMRRQSIPKFVQGNCTGCGDCFVVCPHSALPPLAISVNNLIKGAMATSKLNGKVLKSFIPLVNSIAIESNKIINEEDTEVAVVADFLGLAAQKVFKQKGIVSEKLDQAIDELETLLSLIGDLPIAITKTFFTAQNIQDSKEGELFTLGLDVSACDGCGICESACPENALEMVEETPGLLEKAQQNFNLFEDLPDTDGYILEREVVNNDYDSLAAVLLSRPFYQSINGAILDNEPGQKVILHLIAAITELAIQPKVKKTITEIEALITKLELYIRNELNNALPTKNFDSINEALKASKNQRIPFDEMIVNWGKEEHLKLVDVDELQLRMDLIHDLKEFKWALTTGPTGLGRSRYGLLVDSTLKEIAPYPWSTFTTPVLVNWNGKSTAMAEGLIHGCIRHTIDNIKILRRAQLVAQKKYNPAVDDRELSTLTWGNLTSSEKAIVMPIILLVRKEAVESNKNLLQLLNQPWPIKIVVVDDAVPNPDIAIADVINTQSQIIPLISQQKAIILKSSLADREHLYHGLHAGLYSENAALFWLLAPKTADHSTPWKNWPKLNSMALNTRAFTHIYFNPFKMEKMLVGSFDIENNPMPKQIWNQINLETIENDEEKLVPYRLTWADWAFTQHKWRKDFVELPQESQTITLADYFEADNETKNASTPVIYRLTADDSIQKFAISSRIIATTEAIRTSWKVLQEIAGLKTAFPDRLRREIEVEFSALKDREIEQIKRDHKAKIASLEGEYLEKMKEKINENLLNLSKLIKN